MVQAVRDSQDARNGGRAANRIVLAAASLETGLARPFLRRVAGAAAEMAQGNLAVRVAEEGDREPVELARSFNAMARNLQATQAELEGQNAALAAQREALEHTLDALAAEKHRIEVFHRA